MQSLALRLWVLLYSQILGLSATETNGEGCLVGLSREDTDVKVVMEHNKAGSG